MKETPFPLFKEITIDSIATNCKFEFGLTKTEFEQKVFHANRWLSRVRHNQAKMDDMHFTELFNLLKCYSGNDSSSFISTMKRWYPSLNGYNTEKDITDIIRANLEGRSSKTDQYYGTVMTNKQFIDICLKYDSPIKCIKMSSQTGWCWFDDKERTDLLTKLAQEGITIYILENPTSHTMEKIIKDTKTPAKELQYTGINNTLSKLQEYAKAYTNICFRISFFPILHQTLIIEFEDNSSRALLYDYVYNIPANCLSPHKQILNGDPNLYCYSTEFDFLWNNAYTYEQWQTTLPKPKEVLPSGNYILLYPFHRKSTENKWVYSALCISDNNEATLKVNVTNSYNSNEENNYCEYSYKGNLTLTRNAILISLYDEFKQEEVNISFVRPLNTNNRYIGIMTALSPSGQQPVSFKCACISHSLFPKLNKQILYQLLSHKNKEWGDNLLVLENQDINTFYSDHIFSKEFISDILR